jgi:hypothetical protein
MKPGNKSLAGLLVLTFLIAGLASAPSPVQADDCVIKSVDNYAGYSNVYTNKKDTCVKITELDHNKNPVRSWTGRTDSSGKITIPAGHNLSKPYLRCEVVPDDNCRDEKKGMRHAKPYSWRKLHAKQRSWPHDPRLSWPDARNPHRIHYKGKSWPHDPDLSWGQLRKPRVLHDRRVSFPPRTPNRAADRIPPRRPPIHQKGVSWTHRPRLSWEESY